MVDSKKFEFNNAKDGFSQNIQSGEFKNYEFPVLKLKNDCIGSYHLYFNDTIEKIEADSAYEAVKKTSFRNIDKIVYVSENTSMKNVFDPDELITKE
jgi:hypothetical protein